MMKYADIEKVEKGFRVLSQDENDKCDALLEESSIMIDAYNKDASIEAKELVACRMVRRALGSADMDMPMGATQGTMSALGYSQSWTIGAGGSNGELYISKVEKKLLGCGDRIGSHSVLECM